MESLPKLLITGLARNVASTLPREVERLHGVTSSFYGEVDFHVVESDSTDNTGKVLEDIAQVTPYLSFQTLGDLQSEISDRIARLRFCRNKYVEFYRKALSRYSHVMVVDFDIQNRKFDKRSFQRVVNERLHWDALFANQTGRYFDIFALREKNWCPRDCMEEVDEFVSSGMSRELAKETAIWKRMSSIPISQKPTEVDSAFGGMAMYKSWIFDLFDYSIHSTPIGSHESEHVALHYKAKSAGAHLFIHPGFNNFAWNPHNLASFKWLRKLDQLSDRPIWGGLRRKMRSLLG